MTQRPSMRRDVLRLAVVRYASLHLCSTWTPFFETLIGTCIIDKTVQAPRRDHTISTADLIMGTTYRVIFAKVIGTTYAFPTVAFCSAKSFTLNVGAPIHWSAFQILGNTVVCSYIQNGMSRGDPLSMLLWPPPRHLTLPVFLKFLWAFIVHSIGSPFLHACTF